MRFPDLEYFFLTADSGEYDRIQAAVRERESDGGDRAGDRCDVFQYGGSGGVL